jgi:hypothetical protein
MPMTRQFISLWVLGALLLLVGGCSSMAKGVTDSILEKDEDEQFTRICNAKGYPFLGVDAHIDRYESHIKEGGSTDTQPVTKVLMIHGIGSPQEGYSTEFITNLNETLQLNMTESSIKEINLINPKAEGVPLGKLTVSRHFNKDSTRELIFYELVWSEIIESEKKQIEYDNSGKYSYMRANLNHSMKLFVNDHVPDPMIYYGKSREKIILSVNQALCWMFYGDWDDLQSGERFCNNRTFPLHKGIQKDNYSIVTHSLGSRIIIDSLQWVAEQAAMVKNNNFKGRPNIEGLLNSLREKEFSIYMLANQLPLLQLGREEPKVTNQIKEHCRPDGANSNNRLFKQLHIVAFSDPNDLLSYGIPPQFAREKLDSRICPKITNIEINVAEVVSLFGIGEFANPADAHNGYDNDEQVIRLIAHGIGHEEVPEKTKEVCSWVEIVDR